MLYPLGSPGSPFILCVKAGNMTESEHGVSRFAPSTIVRLAQLVLISCATAVVLAVGASQWQDWSKRARERADLHEWESHSIGADNLPSPESFYPREAVPRPPIVKEFERLTVAEANGRVDGTELVLAVSIGDEARAYPLNMLNGPSREVINDELGGTAIAATW